MAINDEFSRSDTETFIDIDAMDPNTESFQKVPVIEKGEAGPGYTGIVKLGPYAVKGEVECNKVEETKDELESQGIVDTYSAIDNE